MTSMVERLREALTYVQTRYPENVKVVVLQSDLADVLDVVEAAQHMADEAVDMGGTMCIREDYWVPFEDALAKIEE